LNTPPAGRFSCESSVGVNRWREPGSLTPAVVDEFFDLVPDVWRDETALLRIKEYLNFLVDNRVQVCDLIRERIS
jgi:hypothetical protein